MGTLRKRDDQPTVVMVCSQFPPVYGGAGAQAALLAKHLVAEGWDVEVVTLDQEAIGDVTVDGYRVSRTYARSPQARLSRVLGTVALSLRAAIRIARTRPSIVHVHGIYWWTLAPVLVGKLVGAGTVVKSTRDGEDDPLTVVTRRVRGIPIGWLYGQSVRRADAVIVLNRDRAQASAEAAGVAAKTHLLRNGVDSAKFQRSESGRNRARAEFGLTDTDQVLTFVGYLVKHKGVLDLLRAWRDVGTSRDRQLWLVGPVDGFYRELGDEIPAEIERLQADGYNVRVFGHVDRDRLPAILWASDAYTLPSYAEGMPNSLAEAMVAGCQVVGTRIAGIVDILDESSGWLVDPGDVPALARSLDHALSGEVRGVEAAGAALSMKAVTDRYLALYGSIGRP